MGIGRYLIGVACAAAALSPVVLGARQLRRRHLQELIGPPAVLAEVIISLAMVTVVLQLLGTVGLFRLVPIVLALAGAGFIAWRSGGGELHADNPTRTATSSITARPPADRGARWGRYGAIAAVAVVGAEWSTRTVDSLRRGMLTTADTLWYHLPVAARFVQTGWTTRLHFVDGGSYTAFFPASSELIHALGMVFFGNDTLSPLLNLGWLALALLAAWCVGRPFGVASLSLMGAAVVLATPELVLDDAGSALNDIVGLALFLAAIAVLVNAKRPDGRDLVRPVALACAALAAGLALGSKFTLIAPVAALTIGVIALCARGERVRRAALWLTVVAVTGGYWYLRNLFRVGNPLPSLGLGIGPLRLPRVSTPGAGSVASYLFDRRVWRVYFLPGLREAFGPAWWALFVAAAVGCILAAFLAPGRWERMIALVGIVGFVAYVVSPQILGSPNAPLFQFMVNVRYVALALTIGVVLLPVVAIRFGPRSLLLLTAAYACILAAAQFDAKLWANARTTIAGPTRGALPRAAGVLIGVGVFAVGCMWVALRSRATRWWEARRYLLSVAFVVIAALLGGGYAVERSYLNRRYAGPPLLAIDRWARDIHHVRIAIVGFSLQYPLYGSDLSNHVQSLARRGSHGASSMIGDCEAWRQALNDGRYDYVVATTPGFPFATKKPPLEAMWTRADRAATLVLHESSSAGAEAWLFRIHGKLDPPSCPGGA